MKPILRTLTLAGSLLATLSCGTSTGGHSSSLAVPVAWRNAANFPTSPPSSDLARWWSGFDDPLLSRLITDSLRQSPDIASAIARVRQAQAQRKAQASILYPTLDASASRNFSSVESDALGRSSQTSFSGNLSASWEADFFGKNRQSVIAASADADAARENLHSAQAALAAEVALTYIDLRNTEARINVVRESISTREESRKLAAWRNEAGQTDALELRQAESSLQQASASLSSLEQSASQTRNRLSLLSGKNPGSLNPTLTSRTGQLPSPARRLSIGIPADTVRQRPDVRAAGYQWLAAIARTRSAEADRLPSLRLSGSLGADTLTSAKLFNPESVAVGLIEGFTSPVFDAGRIKANIEAQDAVAEQALRAYESTVLTSLSEVEDSLIACKRSTERISTLNAAAASSREALTLATQRYEAGVTDFLTLLDAQRTNLSIRESVVSARADHAAAHVSLYRALGGGWSR